MPKSLLKPSSGYLRLDISHKSGLMTLFTLFKKKKKSNKSIPNSILVLVQAVSQINWFVPSQREEYWISLEKQTYWMKVKLDFSPVAQNQIIFTPYTLSKLSTQQQNKCHSPALLTSKWVIGQQLPCRTLFKSSSITMNKLVCKWIHKNHKTRESEVKFKGLIWLIMNTSRK